MSELTCVGDLKPAPYNPREITQEAMSGLSASMTEFGDLSGIVWNARSGRIVAGHQRMSALRAKYGDGLRLDRGAVVTPDGARWPVRAAPGTTFDTAADDYGMVLQVRDSIQRGGEQ